MTDMRVRPAPGGNNTTPLSGDAGRSLMKAAFAPTGFTALAIIVVMTTVLITSDSDLTGIFAAVGATWLGIHQVTLPISGTNLGVLPLTVTAVVFAATYHFVKRASSAVTTTKDAGQVIAAAVGIPLVMTIISLAIVKDASTVLKIDTPNVLQSFGWTILIHAVAAASALRKPLWKDLAEQRHLPEWLTFSAAASRVSAITMLGLGSAVTVMLLAVSWSDAADQLFAYNGIGAAIGLGVLSVMYLANVVVGVIATSVGVTITVGEGSVSVFANEPAAGPSIPVLTALPSTEPELWWLLLLIIPATAGVVTGKSIAARGLKTRELYSAIAAAAVMQAVAFFVIALAAGGAFGVFGAISLAPLLGALALLAWVLCIGSATAGLSLWLREHRERKERRGDVERAIAEALAEEAEQKAKTTAEASSEKDAQAEKEDKPGKKSKAEAAEEAKVVESSEKAPAAKDTDGQDAEEVSSGGKAEATAAEPKRGRIVALTRKLPTVPFDVPSIPGAVAKIPSKVKSGITGAGKKSPTESEPSDK
ncbi:cell envelope integrity protein TolA [Hoyosella rhizosphaerae]|nr:DUF6350 family protein [Hoyosella rhizosphaerae]MBN4925799.1 cell envelope integrity protein TolA [Hoyosella rhizosphaerae]